MLLEPSNSTSITGQIIITQNINYGAEGFTPQFWNLLFQDLIGTGATVVLLLSAIRLQSGIRLRNFVDSNNNGIQDGEPEFRLVILIIQ